jgi:hypothetical protein
VGNVSENLTVEFKTSFNEDVIETLVAFANTKGSRIIGEENILQRLNDWKLVAERAR